MGHQTEEALAYDQEVNQCSSSITYKDENESVFKMGEIAYKGIQ